MAAQRLSEPVGRTERQRRGLKDIQNNQKQKIYLFDQLLRIHGGDNRLLRYLFEQTGQIKQTPHTRLARLHKIHQYCRRLRLHRTWCVAVFYRRNHEPIFRTFLQV